LLLELSNHAKDFVEKWAKLGEGLPVFNELPYLND
jgi:hypothetical protein